MPEQIHNTEDFVLLFNRGDERGLAYIFDKLYPLMLYYANEWVKDKMLAEDIASTAFVKAWKHHEQLDSFAGIKAYILKVVGRDSKRAIGAEIKRRSLHLSAKPETEETETAFHTIVKAETYNNLHQAIKKLSPGMRAVMESMYIEGHSLTETAKLLNISTSTVDTQKKRAIEKLAKILPRFGINMLVSICLAFTGHLFW